MLSSLCGFAVSVSSNLFYHCCRATYFGFAGEENREKLAKTFKRPTTWKDYCTKVSQSNCTIPDDVATRPPAEDGSEDGRYFSSGFYTGHFRATDKNDCAKTPKCTGHIVDYPVRIVAILFHLYGM